MPPTEPDRLPETPVLKTASDLSLDPNLSESASSWVEATLRGLDARQKIGQLLMPLLFSWRKDYDIERAKAQFESYEVGGAFTFGRDWKTIRAATAEVASRLKVPPLFSCDYECGPLNISDGARFGLAMTLAAVADLEEAEGLAYEVGAASALQGRAVGARWTFAPVVDLSLNRHNPIVNTRSYGDEVERVRRLSIAYLKGLQAHGMAATLKHFPGDGVDGRDQHLVTTVNDLPKEDWDATYRETFTAGIEAGASAVMMGHIALAHRSSRDACGRLLPATMDPRMHHMLREEFGFNGVIVSDAINMSGLSGHIGPEAERVLANLKAGSDIVLFTSDLPAIVERVERALEEGELESYRLDEAVRRVLEFKARLGLHGPDRGMTDEEAAEAMASDRYDELACRLNERAITRIRDHRGDLPLKLEKGAKVVVCRLPLEISARNDIVLGNEDAARPRLNVFEETLQEAGYEVESVDSPNAFDAAKGTADAIIYCMEYNPEAGRGSIRPTKEAFSMVDFELFHSGRPVLFISFGSPYMAWELENAPNFLCAYAAWPVSKKTAARAVLGEIECPGRLPVRL